MNRIDQELNELLALVAEQMDLAHCREVDERYRAALAWENVDRPPLTVQSPFGKTLALPELWARFRRYPYRQAFENPAAMLQNMLLNRVVPGVLLRDDSPLAIRADHGTIQIASLLGGHWQMHEDSYPWIEPNPSEDFLTRLVADSTPPDFTRGVLNKSLRTMEFYREKLAQFPPCAEAIQVSLPDLQGPLDIAEQLWGSEIMVGLYESPELFDQLLARLVAVMPLVIEKYRPLSKDHLDPAANTQHGYNIPGRLLIRNDSAIMLSPGMYAERVRPHDARLLDALGGGAIHFCGNGRHLIEPMLRIPALRGLDFGEPDRMDVGRIYDACRPPRVALTHLNPTRGDLISGKTVGQFPTGVVLVYCTENFSDAQQVVKSFRKAGVGL